jgi:hypothetical protein
MSFTFTLVSQARLQVDADSTSLFLSAADVERLIVELAKFRREMTPEVPRKIPDGQHEGGIADPIFSLQLFVDQKFLALRHPGIGWLTFLLPEAEAQKLGRGLVQRLPQTPGQPTPTRRH